MVHLSVANFTLSLEKEQFSHRTGKHYVLKTLKHIMNVLHRLVRQKLTSEVHVYGISHWATYLMPNHLIHIDAI